MMYFPLTKASWQQAFSAIDTIFFTNKKDISEIEVAEPQVLAAVHGLLLMLLLLAGEPAGGAGGPGCAAPVRQRLAGEG
jgi:hypothetical protein